MPSQLSVRGQTPRHDTDTVFTALMRAALLGSALVALVAGGMAWWLGTPGALGSVIGGITVAGMFFAFGATGLRLILAGPTHGVLIGALTIYFLQITGLLVVLVISPGNIVEQPRWFAAGALAEAIVWQAAQARGLCRARVLAFGSGAQAAPAAPPQDPPPPALAAESVTESRVWP